MRRIKQVSAAAALAALTATGLLPPAADAVVGQIRSTGDYGLQGSGLNMAASRGKSGPNLAVNPNNPNHVVMLLQELETEECEFAVSFDGGTTWPNSGQLQAPLGYATNAPGPCDVTGHGAGNIGQRSIAFGSENNVYIMWTASKQVGTLGFSLLFSKSTNGGVSYDTSEVSAGGVAPQPDYLRPEIVVERRGPATDRLFVSTRESRSGDAQVFRSDNAGASWLAPTAASLNNPILNPAPVWNADNTAITKAGNAYIGTREVTQPALGPVAPGPTGGYRLVGADGSVFTYGNAGNFGSPAGTPLNRPIVGSATTPSGNGYWLVASDGGIFNYGDAKFFGSTGGVVLNKPIVGMASTPSGNGYWLVASDGGIFNYGDAGFFGSTGGITLNKPVVGMAATQFGAGYWLVASDGGIFNYGDAGFFGSTGGITLNKPIVGMAPTATGNGYWLVASDGGIFNYGGAGFFGSAGAAPLVRPIVNMINTPTGAGYWLVASDGGIFNYGDAGFFGSSGGTALGAPIVGGAPSNKIGGLRPLYVAWVAPKIAGTCPPACEQIGENSTDSYVVVAKSLDLGQTWSRSRAINVRGANSPAGTLHNGSHFPRLAVGNGGEVFVVFNQGPGVFGSNNCGNGSFPVATPGASGTLTCPAYGPALFKSADHFMNWDMDVFFLRSTNQGETWGNLQQLNEGKKANLAVAELTQTRHPEMIVAPDGRVDIAWEDRRHWYLNTSDRKGAVTPGGSALGNYACVHSHSSCPDPRLGDTYYAYSTNAGASFSFNRRLNDRSHNNDVGQDYRFSTYWDYGPALAALGNDRLLVADMDARLGNVDNDSLDIILRKVELNTGAVPIPGTAVPGGTGSATNLSVALSQHTYPGGGEAVHGEGFTSRPWTRPVLVNEADYPAALAAGVLAQANLGPLLAVPAAGPLPLNVRNEIQRLKPVGAYIIGDATKVAATAEAELAGLGVPGGALTVRIAGATPADTAAQIATALDRRRAIDKPVALGGTAVTPLPAFDAVIIANPNSASAAAASVLASNRRLPILYVDTNAVPTATSDVIKAMNVNRAIIVGSTGVVSAAVATTLSTSTTATPTPGLGLTVTRLAGADQYATSDAVVGESLARGLPRNIVFVADGDEPMHGALLGPFVGRIGGLLTLTPGGTAAEAEAKLAAAPFNLRPFIDRIRTTDLTGTATVGLDPAA